MSRALGTRAMVAFAPLALVVGDSRSFGYHLGRALFWVVLGGGLIALVVWLIVRYNRGNAPPPYTMAGPPAPPPGSSPAWHPDPSGSGLLRWWDGYRFTQYTTPATGQPGAPPPAAAPPQPAAPQPQSTPPPQPAAPQSQPPPDE